MALVSGPRNSSRPRNLLLAALAPADLALLQPHLRRVVMEVKKDIDRPNQRIEFACFMETGIASVVAVESNQTQVEVGLIGREGMSGTAVVLGGNQSPLQPTSRSPGKRSRSPPMSCAKRWTRARRYVGCCSGSSRS